MSNTTVLFHPDKWLDMKVTEVVQLMHEAGAGKLQMQLCTKDGQPMFALALIQGEDTQALLDAMQAKADALEADQAGSTPIPVLPAADAWRKGARFALEAVSKVDSLCWLTDSMKEVCIKQATEAVIAERDRLSALSASAAGGGTA